jgi:hypothetical protein
MSYGAKNEIWVGLDGIEPVDVPHVAQSFGFACARALCR